MELIVNDLSFHGQFSDVASFKSAIDRVMTIRQIARRFGRTLYCHRRIANATVMPSTSLLQALQSFTLDERRSLMRWLSEQGPFWEDARNHRPDDWFECNGTIVTDTAVGEAAWCCLKGIERALVSLTPSDWEFSPIQVDWLLDTTNRSSIDVANHWISAAIEAILQALPEPLASWEQLEKLVIARCTSLTFAVDAFTPLNGYPFTSSAAQRLLFIFTTLNRFKTCFDANGRRTREGQDIYRDFFTGRKADGGRGSLFSDSSADEKKRFKTEMTFRHPASPRKTLFCSWHGKVQTPQLRVHFSSPIRSDEPLYIVYVGPKITKK